MANKHHEVLKERINALNRSQIELDKAKKEMTEATVKRDECLELVKKEEIALARTIHAKCSGKTLICNSVQYSSEQLIGGGFRLVVDSFCGEII